MRFGGSRKAAATTAAGALTLGLVAGISQHQKWWWYHHNRTVSCVVGANVCVLPTGDDTTCVRGDLTKPCLTMNTAYQKASCGDTVSMVGTFPTTQTINATSKSCTSGTPVTFNASNASSTGLAISTAGYITVNGLNVGGGQALVTSSLTAVCGAAGTSQWVTLNNMTGELFKVQGPVQNVSVIGGNWGPAGNGDHSTISSGTGTNVAPCNTEINGNIVHDVSVCPIGNLGCNTTGTPIHTECLQTNFGTLAATGGFNLTIENNQFLRCPSEANGATGGVTLGGMDGVVFRNNFVGAGTNGAIIFSYDMKNAVVEYNSSPRGIAISNTYTSCSATPCGPYTIRGNYVRWGFGSCDDHVSPSAGSAGVSFTYRFNAALSDGGGGTTLCAGNVGDQFVASLDFINPTNDTDLHSTASATSRGKGDPSSCPATDIDGQTRPQPGATTCDAGADEVG